MGETFFVTDLNMLLHKCEWDPDHIEVPLRLKCILDVIKNGKENLLLKCSLLKSKEANLDDIYLVHSPEYVEKIKSTQKMNKVSKKLFY